MASSSTPSSSTTTTPPKIYEVFLSFRGEDTRLGFTSHLYAALCRKNIETFMDDAKLRRGVEISPALRSAIEKSKIAVVIFSKDYASSNWCLSELEEIIMRMESKELIVMPVFYHVSTDDVQQLKGSYECSFANEVPEAVQKWREALKKASIQTGFDSSVITDEAELIRKIVKAVWKELRIKYIPSSSDFEGLVGIHERIEHVKSLLRLDMKDVPKFIGIWGMGGVGKTTIARAVFQSFSYGFDGACIIEEVGKKLEETGGSERLQVDVLSKVLDEENLKIDYPIPPKIMGMLNQKEVFIVLDDVDTTQMHKISTLKTFVERLINQCGLGSRIIITSRDNQRLRIFNVDDLMIYKVEELNDNEALGLFNKLANPAEDCMALSDDIVKYAKSNPLALTVLGCHFKGKKKHEWESALKKIRGIVNCGIFDVLRISYEDLEDHAKKLFLDLACFKDFYNYQGLLKEEFQDGLEDSLSVLVAKSLITRHKGYIGMHDLLQEMGREIVCRESPNNPGNRSRLWERNDVIQTLENNTGTNAVEVICLLSGPEVISLNPQVFDNMHKLRFLLFYKSKKVHLFEGLKCLPDELMILHWPGYPLTTLPSNFNPKKLVKLDLSGSNIEQFWEETKHAPKFPKLKWLILFRCEHLTRIPSLSDFPLLVEVDLRYCKSLIDFPSSVQQHNNLQKLNLHGTAIEEVPSSIQSLTNLTQLDLGGTAIEEVPSSIQSLTNLTQLDLSGTAIEEVPLSIQSLTNLTQLDLSGTAIEEVPLSIQSLTNLTQLGLSNCTRLKLISPSICKLKSLSTLGLINCSQLETFPEILETMESLKSLNLSGALGTNMGLKVLPPSIEHLNGLQRLTLHNCKNLEKLPSSICNLTSLEFLDLSRCSKLDKLPDNLGNLKSLNQLEVWGSAIGQLPSSITRLENLEILDYSECSLTTFPPLSGLRSLKLLRLADCSLMEIPEDIGCLSSLGSLELSKNMFVSLPKSIKQLSQLTKLELKHCKMLQSIPELPDGLGWLEATDCDQLCQVPDASEFVRCINAKPQSYVQSVKFIFTNSLNLIKAVSNVFEESLRIMQRTEKGSGKSPNDFCIYLPGNKIPEWFSYQSLKSSVNIQVLRNDLVSRKFMGFAICAVFFDEYNGKRMQGIGCDLKIYNGIRSYSTQYGPGFPTVYIDSDHMLLGYCSFDSLFQNPEKLLASDGNRDNMDIVIEFKSNYGGCNQLKRCAVHPIYAEDPIETIGATIQEIGETSGRRSDRSDDNDEEVGPHLKRICTHAIKTP